MILQMDIKSAGDLPNERVVLRSTDSGDSGDFLVLRAYETEGTPLSGPTDAFWLPNNVVTEGDIVVVYSKVGNRSQKTNSAGKTTYFEYWGRSAPIWTRGFAAVLVSAPNYHYKAVSNLFSGDDAEPIDGNTS